MPSQSSRSSSGPFTTTTASGVAVAVIVMAPNLPFGSGVVVSVSVQAHPTRVSTLSGPGNRPYPASYPARPAEGPTNICPGFLLPFGCRRWLLGSSCARQGVGPSSRSADRTPPSRPDPDGVTAFPTHELRPDWAPPVSRGRRCSLDRQMIPGRRLPLFHGQPLNPAPTTHQQGLSVTRHQRRFTRFARPVLPSPVAPGWDEDPRA